MAAAPVSLQAQPSYRVSSGARLLELERVIEPGREALIEVGRALREIRDKKLYRPQYRSFQAYLEERWSRSRQRAYQLMHFSESVELSIVVDRPANERQARALNSGRHLTVHFSSESNEWPTPRWIIEKIAKVLGGIELDPCSDAARSVRATNDFTMKEDGLAREWRGRVYMNPPYGETIEAWVSKLIVEYESGRVTQAIALLPARTDTAWYHLLQDFPVCFPKGRLRFGEAKRDAPFPSVVVYLGPDLAAFATEFNELGPSPGASHKVDNPGVWPGASSPAGRGPS